MKNPTFDTPVVLWIEKYERNFVCTNWCDQIFLPSTSINLNSGGFSLGHLLLTYLNCSIVRQRGRGAFYRLGLNHTAHSSWEWGSCSSECLHLLRSRLDTTLLLLKPCSHISSNFDVDKLPPPRSPDGLLLYEI